MATDTWNGRKTGLLNIIVNCCCGTTYNILQQSQMSRAEYEEDCYFLKLPKSPLLPFYLGTDY